MSTFHLQIVNPDRKVFDGEAQKIILDDCVNVYLFARNNFVMANNSVRNVVVFPIDYYFLTNTMDIG